MRLAGRWTKADFSGSPSQHQPGEELLPQGEKGTPSKKENRNRKQINHERGEKRWRRAEVKRNRAGEKKRRLGRRKKVVRPTNNRAIRADGQMAIGK